MLIGAVNSDNDSVNKIRNQLTGEYEGVPDVARYYKASRRQRSLQTSDISLLLHHWPNCLFKKGKFLLLIAVVIPFF